MTIDNMVRTRAIRVLTILTVLLTLAPWYTVDGVTTIGLADADGRLVAIGSAAGFLLHIFGARFAWIAVAFSAVTAWRFVSTVSSSAVLTLDIGAGAAGVTASVAALLMLWELFASIRAATSDDEPAA